MPIFRLYFWTFFCNKNQVNLAKPWVFGKNPWVFLKILWVYSKEWKIFPKFPEFSWFQALKLKFGQTFVQNISTSWLFWAKSQFLVGKLLSFWIICLSFSKICLSFFSAWVFLALSFFRNVQKKACLKSTLVTYFSVLRYPKMKIFQYSIPLVYKFFSTWYW